MHFSCKGGYGVCERTCIDAFKTRTGLGYKVYNALYRKVWFAGLFRVFAIQITHILYHKASLFGFCESHRDHKHFLTVALDIGYLQL